MQHTLQVLRPREIPMTYFASNFWLKISIIDICDRVLNAPLVFYKIAILRIIFAGDIFVTKL